MNLKTISSKSKDFMVVDYLDSNSGDIDSEDEPLSNFMKRRKVDETAKIVHSAIIVL